MAHFLYIDPGTGSMLFTVIIGLATTAVFLIRGLWLKLKQRITGGKVEVNADKIPLVIFSDHKRYWNVFGPICEELEKRKVSCEFWTMSPDDPALEQNYAYVKASYIGEGSKAFAKLNLMNARVCLATTPGLDVLQWKRSKNTDYYVYIFHAQSDGIVYRMFSFDHFDAIMMTGPLQEQPARTLEAMRHLPEKELILVGSPSMDVLSERAQRLLTSVDTKNKDRKTILCAPSWGESSLLNRYGETFIDALIETGYDIIMRPHPQSFTADKELMEKLQKKYPNGEHFQWNRDNDNFKVLSEADLLISDFSSVVYEYSLIFDRPILYTETKFDKAPYDAAWFDKDPWVISYLSEIGKKLTEDNFKNMKSVIDDVLSDSQYVVGREKARELIWSNQGKAAVKAVDYIILCQERLAMTKKKD